MRLLLAAASFAALTTAAQAGMTCNLTDQHNNALTYSFAHGGRGYTNETAVLRNGQPISNGGPMWNRTFDREARAITLTQGDWSIVYPLSQGQTPAALWHNANVVANGVCAPDYAADSAATVAPAPASFGEDSVGIISDGVQAMTSVKLGAQTVMMTIDTGATHMMISSSVANRLVADNQADEGAMMNVVVADGRTVSERALVIHRVQIGRHVLLNVNATVAPDDGSSSNFGDGLLPFTVLNQVGRFAIDTTSNKLIFGAAS
jgi:Aspartyl protease